MQNTKIRIRGGIHPHSKYWMVEKTWLVPHDEVVEYVLDSYGVYLARSTYQATFITAKNKRITLNGKCIEDLYYAGAPLWLIEYVGNSLWNIPIQMFADAPTCVQQFDFNACLRDLPQVTSEFAAEVKETRDFHTLPQGWFMVNKHTLAHYENLLAIWWESSDLN